MSAAVDAKGLSSRVVIYDRQRYNVYHAAQSTINLASHIYQKQEASMLLFSYLDVSGRCPCQVLGHRNSLSLM